MFYNEPPDVNLVFITFVHRQSQLASQGPVALAEKLTESLRNTGDLDLVEIDLQSYVVTSATLRMTLPIQTPQRITYASRRRPNHAFGNAGISIYPIADALCSSIPLLKRHSTTVPSHNAVVADSGWHALHAAPNTFLGVHSPAGAVSCH